MDDYVSTQSFAELPLSDELRKGIAERGYTQPTPVQAAVFAPIMAGHDLICRSKTGTGKTAAFGIPLLERIPAGTRKASALVLCNTRELALQVAQEIEALGKYKDLKVVAIYGGAGMGQQTDALLDGAEVIVGTPGRVYDHIRRGNLKLDAARICVLDEADEMLSAGFYEEVTKILGTPSSIGVFDDKNWYYISRRIKQVSFLNPDVLDQQVYIVHFDAAGVVREVDHKDLKDGRDIDPAPGATPAPGRELTFLEQVLGNIGRFNKGGSSSSESGSSDKGSKQY